MLCFAISIVAGKAFSFSQKDIPSFRRRFAATLAWCRVCTT
jgi:hypothetical protein